MDERQVYTTFAILILALLLLTRLPAMAEYFTIDNVNLAFSLEKFDPRIHQPQPPGYPFFVFFARIVNVIFGNAERTFVVVSLAVSAAACYVAFALAGRMFSRWAGAAAAFLLLVNPVFWHASLDGPLRPHLALFSLLTASCCWRCWNGERRFAYWGAVALGVGSGFRPDLIAFLSPLWFVSTWAGTKSWRIVFGACVLLVVIVGVWLGTLIIAMGGIRTFAGVMLGYAVEQSGQGSAVFGSSMVAWLRQINRLVIWNALAVVGWIWALPSVLGTRTSIEASPDRARASRHPGAPASIKLSRHPSSARRGMIVAFFFIWIIPGLIVQAMVHVDAPGHTLYSVAALCVLGGYVLSRLHAREFALGASLLVNAIFFLDFFPLPAAVNDPNRTPSIKNAILFGSFEASIGQVRYLDETTRSTLREIQNFAPKDRPSLIITTDAYVDQWFMNWRIGRYYLPEQDFWILQNNTKPNRVDRVRRDLVLESRETPLEIPIFREGRILWLIEPGSAFHKHIAAVQNLMGGKYVFYSDITPDSPPFTIDGVQIIPKL